MWTFPNLKPEVFKKRQSRGDPLLVKRLRRNPEHPVNQTTREIQKLKEKSGHTIYTCLQPQFTMIYGREHDDPMDDLDVHMTTWSIFLNATLRAAVHLGQDHEAK